MSADPLGSMVLVVVAVAGQAVTDGTQGNAVLVVATLQASHGQIIPFGMAEADGAQGMQIRVNISEDNLMPFPGVAQDLADGELGETTAQVLEARDGQQMVVAVGRGKGSGDRPIGEETIVNDVEGFGLVTEVVLAMRSGALFGILVGIGIACTWDVCGTGVARLVCP